MKFDANGKRIAVAVPAFQRESAYWYEQGQVDLLGFCDRPFLCETNPNITHLCSRFDGHHGRCADLHKGEADGKKIRRIEQA